MNRSFLYQSRLRKGIYLGLIVLLFFTTLILRQGVVEPEARKLELREDSVGEVDLIGSAARVSMPGLRGWAVCALWISANEAQKKHEWNDLELLVHSLTKLQPHFILPWLFQSWNLAYNVSVESDLVKDKYYYMSRGIELLSEGERRNREHPDLRFSLGEYYLYKIGMHDENQTLRALFQMSCVDPKERDPRRFQQYVNGQLAFNLDEFELFCKNHPHLVRRLRTIPGNPNDTPEKIARFLEENYRIPGRFEETTAGPAHKSSSALQPPASRFPVLPPMTPFDRSEYKLDSDLPDDFDTYDAARAWFGYSQDAVDEKKNRLPRRPALIIFQGYPARAQFYRAERLEQSGWFDEEGWTIRNWFYEGDPRNNRFRNVAVGTGTKWAQKAWEKAYELYERHGLEHGLIKTLEQLEHVSRKDRSDYNYHQKITNFDHFLFKAKAERTPTAVSARKLFYRADQLRLTADPSGSLKVFEDPKALGPPSTWDKKTATGWKRLLLDHPEFRRDNDVQMEAYEIQLRYLRVLEEVWNRKKAVKQSLLLLPFVLNPHLVRPPIPFDCLEKTMVWKLNGPFDDTDEAGKPLIGDAARTSVNQRLQAFFAGRKPTAPMPIAPTSE